MARRRRRPSFGHDTTPGTAPPKARRRDRDLLPDPVSTRTQQALTRPRIIICGTGRAGTSALVRLLTRLGLDTGYTPAAENFSPQIKAGCEHTASGFRHAATWKNLPRIVKSPELSFHLGELPVPIEHVLIPVRNLDAAATSRKRNRLPWKKRRMSQRDSIAAALGEAIAACIPNEIPCSLLAFPRHVTDPDYTFAILAAVFPEIADRRDHFDAAFAEVNPPATPPPE